MICFLRKQICSIPMGSFKRHKPSPFFIMTCANMSKPCKNHRPHSHDWFAHDNGELWPDLTGIHRRVACDIQITDCCHSYAEVAFSIHILILKTINRYLWSSHYVKFKQGKMLQIKTHLREQRSSQTRDDQRYWVLGFSELVKLMQRDSSD